MATAEMEDVVVVNDDGDNNSEVSIIHLPYLILYTLPLHGEMYSNRACKGHQVL